MKKDMAYEELNKFVGRWITTGRILETDTTPEIKISGTDTYEWLAGKFFLLHKADVFMGGDKNETFEVIGFDELQDNYTMRYYDNKGNSGLMTANCKDGLWTFLGETLRFTGGFKKITPNFQEYGNCPLMEITGLILWTSN